MRIPFLPCLLGLMLLPAITGGCGESHGPAGAGASGLPDAVADSQYPRKRVSHKTVLDFHLVDEASRSPIESGSIQTRYGYWDTQPIRAVKNGNGTWRLIYQTWYFPKPELPPESYFLRGQWLEIDAPGYERVKVALRDFVGERRMDDETSLAKSAPLVVAMQKGERKPTRLEFIAGYYSLDKGLWFRLAIDADGTFSVYIQDQHGRIPVGFGFANFVDERLTLTYAESDSYRARDPQMTELLAMVHAVIKQ